MSQEFLRAVKANCQMVWWIAVSVEAGVSALLQADVNLIWSKGGQALKVLEANILKQKMMGIFIFIFYKFNCRFEKDESIVTALQAESIFECDTYLKGLAYLISVRCLNELCFLRQLS